MTDTLLKRSFDKRGLRKRDLRNKQEFGLPYELAVNQFNGLRPVSPKYAIIYEKIFGIPRSELRPDLWPPLVWDIATAVQKQIAAQHGAQ